MESLLVKINRFEIHQRSKKIKLQNPLHEISEDFFCIYN